MRHRTLDELEHITDARPAHGWPNRWRDNRVPETWRVLALGGGDCWCGAPYGHGWPGKEGGAAHPREEV